VPRSSITPEEFAKIGEFVELPGLEAYSVSAREEPGYPPIVFLHGIPTWSWLWRDVLPQTGQFAHSVALDLPGFGLSKCREGHNMSVTSLASAVESFLAHEFGPHREICLVVHDFGALVGAELIHQAPGRIGTLVVTNTSLRAESWIGGGPLRILSVPMLGQLAMAMARPWMLRLAMRPFLADPETLSEPRFHGYWYPFERGFGQSLARFYQQKPVRREDFDRWRLALHAFTGRSLLLWGGQDPAFTLSEKSDLEQLLPASETFVFPHASHFLPEELPNAVGRHIRAFLARGFDHTDRS
jgi:haloalkane dehalogenase